MKSTLQDSEQRSFHLKSNQLIKLGVIISFHVILATAEEPENCTEILEKGFQRIYNDTTTDCVNNWMSNKKYQFQVCKSQPCFVFLEQEPHVIIEDHEKLPKKPFPCRKAKELGISGAVFDVLVNSFTDHESNYMCVWGGPREECTYNHLVNFLYHFRYTHQFAFANFLVDLPLRRCMHNVGAPLRKDRIVIIGRVIDNDMTTDSPSRMFSNLLRPFHSETWLLFSGLFLIILTLGALVVWFLGPKRRPSLSRTLLFLMGHHEVAQHPHRHRFSISIISLFLNSSIVALSAIMVLFYEIAVVNFLFRQNSIPSLKDVGTIPEEDLIEYCVNKNSAVDLVWRYSCKFILIFYSDFHFPYY